MNKIRIYMDNCCFNRPFDKQSYETIRLESEAKLFIQASIISGEIDFVWSFMLDFENTANPYENKKKAIAEWEILAVINIEAVEAVRTKAKLIADACGIKPKDAIHLSCCIEAKCDYFVTTDRKFLKNVVNPIELVAIMEEKL